MDILDPAEKKVDALISKRWYAVQAFSGYEKIVQKGLLERIAQSEISDQFGEILVPV